MYSQQQEHPSYNMQQQMPVDAYPPSYNSNMAFGDFSGFQGDHGSNSHNYISTATIIEPKYKRNLLPYIAYICFLVLVCCAMVFAIFFLIFNVGRGQWDAVYFFSLTILKALTSIFSTSYLLHRKDLFDTQNVRDQTIRLWPFLLSSGSTIGIIVVLWWLDEWMIGMVFVPFLLNEMLFLVEARRPGPYAGFLSSIYRPWVRVREDNSQFGYFPQQQQQQQGQFASYPYIHGPQQQQYYHDQPFYPQASSSMNPLYR